MSSRHSGLRLAGWVQESGLVTIIKLQVTSAALFLGMLGGCAPELELGERNRAACDRMADHVLSLPCRSSSGPTREFLDGAFCGPSEAAECELSGYFECLTEVSQCDGNIPATPDPDRAADCPIPLQTNDLCFLAGLSDTPSDKSSAGEECLGLTGKTCSAGLVCILPDGSCDAADVSGVCADWPEECTAEDDPVCGCDGVTYPNRCEADRATIPVDFAGECPPPSP